MQWYEWSLVGLAVVGALWGAWLVFHRLLEPWEDEREHHKGDNE